MKETPPLADLAYHDYAALVGYLEEPLALRLSSDGQLDELPLHTNISQKISESCGGYRSRVNANARARAVANGIAADQAPQIADFLFNPIQWVAFGRTDAISLILLDDFATYFSLMADHRFPVVQACLAFCPMMDADTLGLGELFRDPRFARFKGSAWPFVAPEKWPTAVPPNEHGPAAPFHDVQNAAPLLLATRFKVGGITAIGGGVEYQHAVLRTLAKQVLVELDRLEQAAAADPPDGRVVELEIATADVRAVQCLILDGQGSEDWMFLVACTNYSLGIELVTRLRSLTLGDVFETAPEMAAELQRVELHSRILRRYGKPPAVAEGWSANHVFSDSHTTLAVADWAVRDLDRTAGVIRGHVQVVAQIDANPGHMLDIEDTLRDSHAQLLDRHRGETVVRSLTTRPHRFLVGRHDYLQMLGEDPDGPMPVIATRDFFRFVDEFLRRAVPPSGRLESTACEKTRHETGFMSFSSSVVVPFPRLGQIVGVKEHHLPVLDLLTGIGDKLFGPGGTLSIQKLKDVCRKLRMPWSLSGAVERLFQTFAAHLADPYVFDSVLDLYDPFCTLHALVTEDLPRYQSDSHLTSPFGQWMTRRLDELLEALKNAIDHRVRLMLPNADMRDRAADLRGGLSKLVAAADVPLKCGLYLVNKTLERRSPEGVHGWPVDRVGGVIQFSFNPQTRYYRLTFRCPRRILVRLRMDVLHVTRPTRFVAHFHEAAHLLSYRVSESVGAQAVPTDLPADDQAVFEETVSEVFAETLTLLFVFRTDAALFLRRYVANYGVHTLGFGSETGFGDSPEDAKARFFTLCLRGFFVTRPFMDAVQRIDSRQPPTEWNEHLGRDVFDNPLDPRHEDAFIALVEEFGPFYAPFEGWWEGAAAGGGDHSHEESLWRQAYRADAVFHAGAAGRAWDQAFDQYCELHRSDSHTFEPREIVGKIRQAFLDGRPFSRLLTELQMTGQPQRDTVMRTVHLVCWLLYMHTRDLLGKLDPDCELHLHRNSDGQVAFNFPGRKRKWDRFQLDGPHSGLFCADPKARRRHIREQIVILKSFWDISAYIRQERLNQIIKCLWPDTSPVGNTASVG